MQAQTLRSVSFLLSLVLCLAGGVASSAFAQPFIGDINRWTAQDALAAPVEGSILFTGSSSIRRWEQLALDFSDYNIIQRGFGGSQFENLNLYVNDIVLPYRPSAIVVWEGTNDINSGETGAEVFGDYQNFVNLVHADQPEVEIFYLGIMPTPGRFNCCEIENTNANTAIANFASSNPRLHYVDLPASFNALNPPSGQAFNDLFVDAIHLNRQGYELWTSVIRPQVEAVIAPNKVFTPNPQTLQAGERLLFDFGPSNTQDGDPTVGPDANGSVWNNWHPAEGGVAINAGERLTNLSDDAGAATGINLTVTGGFSSNGKPQGGLKVPDDALLGDFAIATVTQDYFFSSADNLQGGGNDDRPGGFMLDGLNPELAYNFRFFGSRQTAEVRITDYIVTGANSDSATLQTSGTDIGDDGVYDGNNSTIASVSGIRPDEFGQIFVDLLLKEGQFAYIAGMEVTAVQPVPEPTAALSMGVSLSLMLTLKRHARQQN